MRQPILFRRVLPLLALALPFLWSPTLQAADKSAHSNSGPISGRVVDAATKKPVPGTVVVALESGEGAIVNATSPDGNGNFSFTQVRPGSYALMISGQDANRRSYTPVLVTGKAIAPGAKLGTVELQASGTRPAQVNVPVVSDKPITVTLSVNQKVGERSYTLPWADGTPTFDTSARANCSGGAACSDYQLQMPASEILLATFDGSTLRYAPKPVASSYSVMANAYTQNGARPTCDSHASAPLELSGNRAKAGPNTIVFSGCE
jgi:hypothetical protein